MSISKEHKLLNATLDEYRARLNTIPDDQFDVTPPKGGWSSAEVYSHIMQATLMSFIAVDKCTLGNFKPTKDGLNFWGMYVMLMNRFPPMKTTVPQKTLAKMPVIKISKEEARNLIVKCHKRVEDTLHVIHEASKESRAKHPRLGMLTAEQWYKFIRIHLQHHLRQLDRIKKEMYTNFSN